MRSLFVSPILFAALLLPMRQANPGVRIQSPQAGQTISGTVEISGSASLEDFAAFRLEFAYEPNPTGTWFPIVQNSSAIQNGVLAVWDTGGIRAGTYNLRLTVLRGNGSFVLADVAGIHIRQDDGSMDEKAGDRKADPNESQSANQIASGFPAPTEASRSELERPEREKVTSSFGFPFLLGGAMALAGFLFWQAQVRFAAWRRNRRLNRSTTKWTRNG